MDPAQNNTQPSVPKPSGLAVPKPEEIKLPESFLNFHYTVALPNFIKTRPKHIEEVLANFNILGLLSNLFSPYKRMTLSGKASLADKISFNITSSVVGAMVRGGLIIAGLLVTVFFVIFDLLAIVAYPFIPIISVLKYNKLQNEFIFARDLKSADRLLAKIKKTNLFIYLCSFFDATFQNMFTKIPDPATIGTKVGQKTYEPLIYLASNWQILKDYLETQSIKESDFKILVSYLNDIVNNSPVIKPAPLGQALIYGYTNNLERFGVDLTTKSHPPYYGKRDILEKIAKVLTRPHNNNVILVGEPGTGKHTLLSALASSITKGEIKLIQDKRLFVLDIVSLLGSSQNMQEVQASFEGILEEAKKAGNIILAIDEIDRITTSDDGRIDLSEIINTIQRDSSLPLLGLATIEAYNQYIRTSSTMNALFERIDIEEPTRDQMITIMAEKAIDFWKKENVMSSLPALLEIVDKSNRLLPDKFQPEKSIIVLEDSISLARSKNQKQLDVATVDEVISEKTKTPVGKISQKEAEKLTDLEKILHKRIVGQSEAIEQISKAMRRARAELESSNRPMGSFLFLGPTGVGKTETAKALAEAYFGNENKMVRLDMTEFQGTDAASRLIGNPQTKSQGQLTTQVRENPFGILLIDEFEKASRDVQNLFLQILDEGHLTDAFGKKVSFDNIIVIATSNAAAEYIREQVEKSSTTNYEPLTKNLIYYVLSKGLFSPELINRFDATVVYKPLNQMEVVQVAYLMLSRLATNLKNTKNITLEITPEVAQAVAKTGFVQAFGARPIRRLIQDKIEDEIAKLLIGGNVKNGDTIHAQTLLSFLA